MKYTIEDLANGEVVLLNDGTLEELQGILKKAFPDDYELEEDEFSYDYFFKSFNTDFHEWDYENFYSNIDGEMRGKPLQSTKDFLEPKNELKQGEMILVRNDEDEVWQEAIFICELNINKNGYKYMTARSRDKEDINDQYMRAYMFKMAKPKPKTLREEFLEKNKCKDTIAYIEWLENKVNQK